METEKEKKNRVVIILIIASGILILVSFGAPYVFTITTENPRFDFNKTGPIGDTIGGLMNPFIALAGVFITFLAFYMQLKANQIQIKLFNTNQIEQTNLLKEQMFFRLVDGLNQRIVNFSHSESGKPEIVSYKALDNLIDIFFHKIDYECISLGRQLLATIPEKLGENHYSKILHASGYTSITDEDVENFRNSIVQLETFNERWERIKLYVGSTDTKSKMHIEALKSIGRVQFYKIDFEQKESIYINCYDKIYQEYGGFMDGYTKNITYLINFICKSEKNDFFIDYLKSNISDQELILIFYFCASRKSTQKFRTQVKNIKLLDNLYLSNSRFIDLPSKKELNAEITNVLNESINR